MPKLLTIILCVLFLFVSLIIGVWARNVARYFMRRKRIYKPRNLLDMSESEIKRYLQDLNDMIHEAVISGFRNYALEERQAEVRDYYETVIGFRDFLDHTKPELFRQQ